MKRQLPWLCSNWTWPGQRTATRQLLIGLRSFRGPDIGRDDRRIKLRAASILAEIAVLDALDDLLALALDETHFYVTRVDAVYGMHRLLRQGAHIDPHAVQALLAGSALARPRNCCCVKCASTGGQLFLGQVVSLFRSRSSLRLVFRFLERKPVEQLGDLLRSLHRSETPAPELIYWLAERVSVGDRDPRRRLLAALAMRQLGVRLPALDLEFERAAKSVTKPWFAPVMIALTLDELDRPFLDVDRFTDALGTGLERSIRMLLLKASFGARTGRFPPGARRALGRIDEYLASAPAGFELAAKLLETTTLAESLVGRLAVAMFMHDRGACFRWLARRAGQVEMQPALRRVANELAHRAIESDREFIEAALRVVQTSRREFERALERLDAASPAPREVDLTTAFRQALSGDISAREFANTVRRAGNLRPLPDGPALRWLSRRSRAHRAERLRGAG